MKDSHTSRYTNVGELTKAIQIKVFGGRGNVTQQGDLGALIKIKFSPPPSSLNLASLSLLHISVCSMFPLTFSLSFLSFISAFLASFCFCFLPSCRSSLHSVPSVPAHHGRDPLLSLAWARCCSQLSPATVVNGTIIKWGVCFHRLLKSKLNNIKM